MPGQLTARLAADQRGTTMVLFALLAVPVAGVASTAVDLGRASHVRMQLQRATDAAGESAREVLHLPAKELTDHVRVHVAANLPRHLKSVPVEVLIAADRRSLEVSIDTEVATTLMGIVGIPKLRVEVASVVSRRERPELSPGSGGALPSMPPETEKVVRDLFGGASAAPPTLPSDNMAAELRALGELTKGGAAPRISEQELNAELMRALEALRAR